MPLNAKLFVWFRLLFNCRFYYPVYTVMFLDYGLDMTQFAMLNVVWAVTIVLLEVPSGAMADVMGRRNLVVLSASIMVVEMLVFAVLPIGGPWVMGVFLVNRVLSGAAEAFSSGADEALAYDSIEPDKQPDIWPSVMARLSRWSALGFIVSALVGAFVYDANSVNWLLRHLGWAGANLSAETTLKFPIYLCFLSALGALGVALSMKEPAIAHEAEPAASSFSEKVQRSWQGIVAAGKWIWSTKVPFLLVLLGFLLDSIVRLFYTVASNYYRLIGLAEASFGVISVLGSILAFVTSGWMEWLVRNRTIRFNFIVVILMIAWGQIVLAIQFPGWWGVALLIPLLLSMRFLQFFLSHYLNQVTSASHRATVLSFRGLTTNLAYGSVTLLFGWQMAYFSGRLNQPNDAPEVFSAALKWWPWWFAGTMAVFAIIAASRSAKKSV